MFRMSVSYDDLKNIKYGTKKIVMYFPKYDPEMFTHQ